VVFANLRVAGMKLINFHQGLGPGGERVYRYVICVFVSPFFKLEFLVQSVLIVGRSVVNQACFTNDSLLHTKFTMYSGPLPSQDR
jgi:hypothetical protein